MAMAGRFVKSKSKLGKSIQSVQSAHPLEDLQDANVKLKMALQSERSSSKQLRREMAVHLKQIREEEHQKALLTTKDLKSRLHFEKVKELDFLRDNLNKKFDSEYKKLVKSRDTEVKKLQNEVKKLQDELQLVASSTTKGLSTTMARDTFEPERQKLFKEVQDLQGIKRNLESEVALLREHDKKLNFEVKKLKEDHAIELMKKEKEADIEVKKLLEELKSKHRQLLQLQDKVKYCPVDMSGSASGGITSSGEKKKSRSNSNSSGEDQSCAPHFTAKPPAGSVPWTPKTSDLSSKLKQLDEKCKTLEEEKQKLQIRLKEMGRKHRPLLEKNKKFLEKNMELSSVNRSLEDRIRDITQEHENFKREIQKREKTFLQKQHSLDDLSELSPEDMAKELKSLQQQGVENDKTIAALKLACAEKDRRIELILHRKRKQRTSKAQNKSAKTKASKNPSLAAAGIKETYFGYDEADSNSIDDSEMSLSICSSVDMLDDEDVFEEFTREEFEANYQRLVKEHLELERSVALLQENVSNPKVDPQRGNKVKSQLESKLVDAQSKIDDLEKLVKNQGQDTSWIEEKEKLNKTIRALKEKIISREEGERRINFELEELQEQNEVLEFRTLELEEQCEKLSEQLGTSVSFSGEVSLSDCSVLKMYAEEKGILEVKVTDLKENLNALKDEHATDLSTEEKITVVQACVLIDTADKKLKDFINTVEALKTRIKVLEEEKADILSKEEGVTTDLVLEYEATRNQLIELQLKCSQLENECEELNKAEAVHNYKENHFDKLEVGYKDEIAQLKRRLSSASEGRGYENEVFQDKLSQLKSADKRLNELTSENQNLHSRIAELQRECVDLHEQLTIQQDTLSLTESDKDTVTHTSHNLKNKMSEMEKLETEAMEKLKTLENEIAFLKNTNNSLKTQNNSLRNSTNSLERTLEELKVTNSELTKDVDELQNVAHSFAFTEKKLKEDNAQLKYVMLDLSDSSRQVEDELEAKLNELAECQQKNAELQALQHCRECETKIEELTIYKEKCLTLEQDLKEVQNEADTFRLHCDVMVHKQSLNCSNGASLNGAGESDIYKIKASKENTTQTDIQYLHLDSSKLEELESEILELMNIISEKDKSCKCKSLKEEVFQLKNDAEEKEALIIESMDTINLLQDRLKQYEDWKRDAEEKISEVDCLQEALIDLEQNNSHLRSKVKQQEQDIAEFMSNLSDKDCKIQQLESMCNTEMTQSNNISGPDLNYKELLNQLSENEDEIAYLQQKVISLEKADQESAKKILELLDTKTQLCCHIKQLEEELDTIDDNEELKFQVEQLEKGKEKLQEKVQELQDLLDEEVGHTTILEKQISKLKPLVKQQQQQEENSEKPIVTFKLQSADDKDAECPKILIKSKTDTSSVSYEVKEQQDGETVLNNEIMELQQQLERAHEQLRCSQDELVMMDEEQSGRINTLEERLHAMEDNELKLSETVLELEEIEKELRQKIRVYETDSPDQKVKELKETVANLEDKLIKYEQDSFSNIKERENKTENVEQKGDRSYDHTQLGGTNDITNDQMAEKVEELETEIDHLKDQVLKSKLDAIKTLQDSDDFPEGYASIRDLHNKLKDLENKEIQLIEKLNVLQNAEEKLMEQSDVLGDENEQLKEQVSRLSEKVADSQGSSEELQIKLGQMRKREQGLLHIIETIKQKQELTEKQSGLSDKEQEEFEQLKEKVSILLDSEAKLMDKLEEKEENENEVKSQLEVCKQSVQQLELEKAGVTEKLKRLQILEEMHEGNVKLQEIAQQRITELEAVEQNLKEKLGATSEEDNFSEVDFVTQNSYLQKQVMELESVLEDYEGQLQQSKEDQEELLLKLNEFEDNEKVLKTKFNELQVRNNQLLNSVQSTQEKEELTDQQNQNAKPVLMNSNEPSENGSFSISDLKTLEPLISQSSHEKLHSILPNTLDSNLSSRDVSPSQEANVSETLRSYTPVDAAAIETMSRDEVAAKLHQVQELENFHRAKICEMKEHLSCFRQAMEVVAVALEADAEIPLLKMKPKSMDTDFETRVNELVKSEVMLKLKVLEMEKKEGTLKKKLEDCETTLREQKAEFRLEQEKLETLLQTAQKNEARYRNKLQYGSPEQESPALVKIQELEEQVIDLESVNTKLKREVEELTQSVFQLNCRIEDIDTGGHGAVFGPLSSTLRRSTENKDKYWDLVGQIKTLETSEKELKERVEELKKEDVDSLVKRISDLERSEKGLKLKLDLIEGQEPSFFETVDLSMLDSPEAILKQRVKELETMERHLKQQVGELEKDREELHEIARKDKNMIHELNVHIRELQLSEKNLRDQLNRYDVEDSKLHSNLDDLQDENEEIREEMQKLQSRERSLNAQLQKILYQETDLSLQLENTKEDMKLAEDKLKKKVVDLESDKRNMRQKCDELTDRIGDLEGTEISMKQKLRHMENNETQLKTRIKDLEQTESNSVSRLTDLESFNEIMSVKLRKLEEDKSGMMYDVSSLQFNKEELEHEVERLQAQVKTLRTRLEDIEMRKSAMQQRLDDYNGKEVEMHSKLQDLERCDKEWRDRIQFLEHNEEKLRHRIRELEASLNSAESMMNNSNDFENEISTLQSVVEFHQQESFRLEADKSRLLEKISRFEYARTNDQMAMVPSVELTELRNQAAQLDATELEIKRLEKQEINLKETIEQLRDGKDACGHQFEIEELKKKADQYNKVVKERDGIQRVLTSTKKAQALMRTNYEDTKAQLSALQSKVKDGQVKLKQTSSKAIQIKLTEEYTLKNLSAEFKNALKHLGARHPEAYEDFVRLLQPSQKNISHATVTSDSSGMTLTEQADGIKTNKDHGRHGRRQASGEQQQDANREEAINRLAQNLQKSEKQLWKAVEGRRSQEVSDDETDHPHWTQVEKNMVPPVNTEEMTVTVNFEPEGEGYGSDASNGPGHLRKAKSNESVHSTGSLPPPLPTQAPPTFRRSQSPSNESYYLPSADEASEIVDEDDLHPKHNRRYRQSTRAKSAERDSDFSEMTAPLSYGKKRMGKSLDSIPDDSGYQEVDFKVLKEKISYLEEEIEKKDREMVQIKEKSVVTTSIEEDNNRVKTKLDNIQRQLETQQRVNKDSRIELDTRNREVQTLRMKIELLEKTNLKKNSINNNNTPLSFSLKPTKEIDITSPTQLKTQLDNKDKELKAKCNEVDRLTQELRQWQEDCLASKEVSEKAKHALDEVQHQADCFLACQENYEKLLLEHDNLKEKHEAVLSSQNDLKQASEDKLSLEKVVVKLRSQLKDLEQLELEKQTHEAKVKALENEVKQKSKLESELSRQNIKLKQLVDSLQRENAEFKDLETQYKLVMQQYQTMEEIKVKAQTMITPLRAKVLRLAQKCKQKNQLISVLSQHLRKYEEGSEVLRDADAVKSEEQDYNRPISPLSSKALEDLETEIKNTNLPRIKSSKKSKSTIMSSNNRQGDLAPSNTNHHSGSGDLLQCLTDDADDLLDPNLINGFHSKPPQNSHLSKDSIPYVNSQPIKRNGAIDSNSVSDSLKLLNPPHLSYRPVTLLDSQHHQQSQMSSPRHISDNNTTLQNQMNSSNIHHNVVGGGAYGVYKAVKDYDPSNFSRSGHPKLELAFREGDVLKPLGAIDDKGYVEAELNGQVGLVPISYLTPVHINLNSDVGARRRLPSVPQSQPHNRDGHIHSSPEQILKLHEELASSHVPSHTVLSTPPTSELSLSNGGPGPLHTNVGSNKKPQRSHSLTISHPAFTRKPPLHPHSVLHPRSRPNSQPLFNHPSRNASPSLYQQQSNHAAGSVSLPTSHRNTPTKDLTRPHSTHSIEGPRTLEPPSHFRIKRIVGHDGVLLIWTPPSFDELARNNGIPVKGYKIYVNNKDSQHIPSPFMCKALIEHLNLHYPHTFNIQTVGEGGIVSSSVETTFVDVLPEGKDLDSSMEGERSCTEYSQGGSSSGGGSGERRVFMAVYDYSASTSIKQSTQELSFKTGDVVVCYGRPRDDGYYFGKVHGKKGLVPASFIEEVAVIGTRAKRSHSSGSSALSPRYPPSTSSSHSTDNIRLNAVKEAAPQAKTD